MTDSDADKDSTVGRRQESSFDDVVGLLKLTPSWVGPVLAVLTFAGIRWLLPMLLQPKPGSVDAGAIFRPLLPMLSWLVGGMMLVGWVLAELHKLRNRQLFAAQTGVNSIHNLPWQDFEQLVAEYYRRGLRCISRMPRHSPNG